MTPVLRWIRGEHPSAICADSGEYEGNFVRMILRLANIVEEWIAVATLEEEMNVVAALAEIKMKLVRDLVVPQSL